ncbi:gas vesicle protein GvpG [Bacillus sp. AFS076308]|uniref:gas vesicle protein GvpG n=1 Tax=unclassified Bacillus (in: firmicutes) TaxID=185979 RepID=UPI000BF5845A|nr:MULTISPECIES: gas vesicle protein GvpG [unclassified Bacillus (in: firmicutes)]PFO08292.1 gas vesicle protein GvpG [Bacillus sp. AFS076308]PGV50698.1 gas vesicle protein GvpG [Bacillus sp. AFS037270]
MIHKLFTLPIRSIIKLGEKIQEEVDQELYNLPLLQQQLVELHMMYELGEIDDETYDEQEEELLRRYKIAKEREQNERLTD